MLWTRKIRIKFLRMRRAMCIHKYVYSYNGTKRHCPKCGLEEWSMHRRYHMGIVPIHVWVKMNTDELHYL